MFVGKLAGTLGWYKSAGRLESHWPIHKKAQKTPAREIALARQRMKEGT